MQQQFLGLTMPVFAAFGWSGEEQALTYALAQLEEFIRSLHAALPRRVQNHLPFFGLNQENQAVYLAASQNPAEDVYVAFYARPLSLEIQLAFEDEMAISRALEAAESAPERWSELLERLGEEWSLHVKQMEVDESSGERSSYQDLFKDVVERFDGDAAQTVSSRAAFLNGEPQWITPIYISRRFPSEQVAAMATGVVRVMADQVRDMVLLLEFMTGKQEAKAEKKARVRPKAKPAPKPSPESDPKNRFVHVAQVKPLHIRRGFVNLTPEHWAFFGRTARSTTREITVKYEDQVDKGSSVWRLASNDMARIVLSDAARGWLEEMFEPGEKIQVTATKLSDEEIEVILEPAE